jgi:alpha-ribazole phosphatase
MSALWLQRHAQPLIAPGICYGRTNMAADDKATAVAAQAVAAAWQAEVGAAGTLWHSPLQRCELLAHAIQALDANFVLNNDPRLAEIDFGAWEGVRWDDIDRTQVNAWSADFWDYAPGGGESLAQMMARIAQAMHAARAQALATHQPVLWVTHAGVIQCAHWLATRGDRQPTAKEWPSVKVAYGEWIRLPLR